MKGINLLSTDIATRAEDALLSHASGQPLLRTQTHKGYGVGWSGWRLNEVPRSAVDAPHNRLHDLLDDSAWLALQLGRAVGGLGLCTRRRGGGYPMKRCRHSPRPWLSTQPTSATRGRQSGLISARPAFVHQPDEHARILASSAVSRSRCSHSFQRPECGAFTTWLVDTPQQGIESSLAHVAT